MERLLNYFIPEKYELKLRFDLEKKKFSGEVNIAGEVKNKTVKFHAVNLEIKSASVNGKPVKYDVGDGVLSLLEVELGEADVEIVYEGILNENMEGAYLSTYKYKGKTESIIATQFESHYAREAFPCIDEPEAKAVFALKIEMPEKFDGIVLSNMPEDGSKGNVFVFKPTPRMSTYLLAWAIGKFHGKTVENRNGVKITTYCALNQDVDAVDFANEVAVKALEFYDENYKVKYPLPKLTQVALPDFEAGAMENWGLVTYRESMLLAGKNATLATKKGVALTVAHELAHQWFGNLVTMKWWDDLWLNESFASVMEYYAVDESFPEFKIWEGFFTGDCLVALMRDALEGVQSVHQEVANPAEIATLFDSAIVYSKGARLMLMLIRAMGWDKFCEGIRDYFQKFAYANTVGDDLWECLTPYADFDVSKLMHAFIDQSGYPVVINEGKDFDKIVQQRFLIDGGNETNVAKKTEKDDVLKVEWPLPEIREDMSGHYILNLSEAEFEERLAKFDQLGLEEKLRLLIDRYLLARAGMVSNASLVPLIVKFKEEKSASVWNILITMIAQIKIFFPYGSKEEGELKQFIRELVQPRLSEVGLFAKDNDDENTIRLRGILNGLDFYTEDVTNLQELAKQYKDDVEQIEAESRADVLDAKLYVEPQMIEKYLTDYKKMVDPELKFELLFAGTVSKNPDVLKKMVSLLEQPEIVKPQDQLHLFIYLFRNMQIQGEVMEWLTKHWDDVKKMGGEKSLESYPRYAASAIRTEEMHKKWREFFEPMMNDPALKRAIEVGKREIEARLALIKHDAKAVQEAVTIVL